ncbi:MAG: trigger factor [bacterium]
MEIQKKDNVVEHSLSFTVTVEPVEMKPFVEKAKSKLGQGLKIAGFRKGKIPEQVLEQYLAPHELLTEAVQMVVLHGFREVLDQEKIEEFLGRPQFDFDIDKFDPEQTFTYVFTIAKIPEVILGDLDKVDVPMQEVAVTDEDIKREREEFEKFLHQMEQQQQKQEVLIGKTVVPPFEELLKKYTSLSTTEDFEENAHRAVHDRKVRENLNVHTQNLLDAIVAVSEVKLPKVLIDIEVEEMVDQVRSDLVRYQVTLEEYLEKKGTTIEAFRAEQLPNAEQRAKIKLVLDKIAEGENITVLDSEIDVEKKIMLAPYYDKHQKLNHVGKELSKKLATPQGKDYLKKNIRRDKVVKFLLKKYVPKDFGKLPKATVVKPKAAKGSIELPGK